MVEEIENDKSYFPNTPAANGEGGVESDDQKNVDYHDHEGVNSPKIDYLKLKNLPELPNVAGSNTQVQFNDNGVLGGDAGLTFNKSAGGSFSVAAKQGSASGAGGDINLTGGDGGASSGNGGDLNFNAGDATAGTAAGGDVVVTSGNGHGASSGGQITVTAGQGGATDYGGSVALAAGAGGATSGGGGNFSISGGNAIAGDSSGGNILLTPGVKSGTGTPGAQETIGQYYSNEFDNGNVTSTATIDWSKGNVQYATMTGNVTLTFTNPKAGARYILQLAGAFTPTFPGTVRWSAGSTPAATATSGKKDIYTFIYSGKESLYDGLQSPNYAIT